jgi:hypothetical protein
MTEEELLAKAFETYNQKNEFKPGDFVRWKCEFAFDSSRLELDE